VTRDSSGPVTLVVKNVRSMLKISHVGWPGLSPAISAQFTLKMCVAAQNRKKFTKNPILGFQGHSRSSMLTLLRNMSLVLVMISRMSVPICNCFHSRRANISKITTFRGVPLFYARSLNLEDRHLDC